MKTRYLAALAAAALSFALLSGCTQTEPPAGEEGSAPAVPEQKETMTVMAEGAGSGTSQKTGRRNVTLYTTDNGYTYYSYTISSGVTP